MKIKTERLLLKPFDKKDIESLVDILKNKEIKETYMIPDFDSEDKYYLLAEKFLELSLDEKRYVRGIYLENVLIGFINDVEIYSGSIELGYVISPKYKNNGFASEALKASIYYLFDHGFLEVVCGAFTSNLASIKVMEKAGLILLNKMETIQYKGIDRPCIYYSIFKGKN